MKKLMMIAVGVALVIAGYVVVNRYLHMHSATVVVQWQTDRSAYACKDGGKSCSPGFSCVAELSKSDQKKTGAYFRHVHTGEEGTCVSNNGSII